MDRKEKKRLEQQFGRPLTDGEAAEITHTQVVHPDDEENVLSAEDVLAPMLGLQRNGQ